LVGGVVDPEAGAQARLLPEARGRAKPRRDVLVVWFVELEALRRKTGRDQRFFVFREHGGVPSVGLYRSVQLVAQAEAQREVACDLPDVVDEEPIPPAAHVTL